MKLNKKTFTYIGIMTVIALIAYGFLIKNFEIPDLKMLLFWTSLTIVVESLLIMLPNNSTGVSVGSAMNLASIVVGGPLLGTTSSLIGLLLRFPKVADIGYIHLFNTPYYITIFNLAQSVIVTFSMGMIYIGTGGQVGELYLIQTILIVVFGAIFNTIIMSRLMSLHTNQEFKKVWLANMRGIVASVLGVGTIGIVIALVFISYGYGAVLLFFGPLLLARYSFKLYMETRNLYLSTIQAFNSVLEAKDPYTSGHTARVEDYAVKLAEAYDISFEGIQLIRDAAVLHDIGKIGINDNILNKESPLTQEEYNEIKRHPEIGAEIVGEVDFLKKVSVIVRHHHERYDGKGYPDGLSKNQVPIESYVLGIVDSYDAMTSDRPYRKALTKEEAIKEIRDNAGSQFHPGLAEKFIEIILQDKEK